MVVARDARLRGHGHRIPHDPGRAASAAHRSLQSRGPRGRLPLRHRADALGPEDGRSRGVGRHRRADAPGDAKSTDRARGRGHEPGADGVRPRVPRELPGLCGDERRVRDLLRAWAPARPHLRRRHRARAGRSRGDRPHRQAVATRAKSGRHYDMRVRDVPRTKRPQAASTPTGAAPKGTAYEPVRSKRKPAAAGPRAAPARQPRLSTPMMAPMARSPNTSGMTLATMVSAAANPAPKSAMAASITVGDGSSTSPIRASVMARKPARTVVSVPRRSEASPERRRPTRAPTP